MSKLIRTGIVLLITLLNIQGAYAWFEDKTPLNRAHQMMLERNYSAAFSSIIQVWQSENDDYFNSHLNDLLDTSLEHDCGKSLTTEPLAVWLQGVVIRRQSLQSPGRIASKLVVETSSSEKVASISLLNKSGREISNDKSIEEDGNRRRYTYQVQYDLNQPLPAGLYKVVVKRDKGRSWSSWIVMGKEQNTQVVRWESQDSWAVDRNGLLNPYCSFPTLSASLYDFVDDSYVRVWNREYEKSYPQRLPPGTLKPDRYVLAISLTLKRWQGVIAIEDQQVISKTYDISAD